MLNLLARDLVPRLLVRALLLVAVLFAVFAAVDRLPGDAATAMLGADRTDAALAETRARLGLDAPVLERFGRWLAGAAQGDVGTSAHGRPVGELLAERLPVTVVVAGVASVLTLVASIAVGVAWARSTGRLARATDAVSTGLVAVPEFVAGTLLVAVFALGLGALPAVTVTDADGRPATLAMWILPIASLVVPQTAWNARVVRAAVVDALEAPHVQAAELAGVRGVALLRRHVLPQAAPTLAASLATSVGMLVMGTVAVEALFNHPGVGSLVQSAVADRDVPVLAAVLAVTGVLALAVLTAADGVRLAFTPGRRAAA